MDGYISWKGLFIHPDTPEDVLKVWDEVIDKTCNIKTGRFIKNKPDKYIYAS